jgi:hypothetical protein
MAFVEHVERTAEDFLEVMAPRGPVFGRFAHNIPHGWIFGDMRMTITS